MPLKFSLNVADQKQILSDINSKFAELSPTDKNLNIVAQSILVAQQIAKDKNYYAINCLAVLAWLFRTSSAITDEAKNHYSAHIDSLELILKTIDTDLGNAWGKAVTLLSYGAQLAFKVETLNKHIMEVFSICEPTNLTNSNMDDLKIIHTLLLSLQLMPYAEKDIALLMRKDGWLTWTIEKMNGAPVRDDVLVDACHQMTDGIIMPRTLELQTRIIDMATDHDNLESPRGSDSENDIPPALSSSEGKERLGTESTAGETPQPTVYTESSDDDDDINDDQIYYDASDGSTTQPITTNAPQPPDNYDNKSDSDDDQEKYKDAQKERPTAYPESTTQSITTNTSQLTNDYAAPITDEEPRPASFWSRHGTKILIASFIITTTGLGVGATAFGLGALIGGALGTMLAGPFGLLIGAALGTGVGVILSALVAGIAAVVSVKTTTNTSSKKLPTLDIPQQPATSPSLEPGQTSSLSLNRGNSETPETLKNE